MLLVGLADRGEIFVVLEIIVTVQGQAGLLDHDGVLTGVFGIDVNVDVQRVRQAHAGAPHRGADIIQRLQPGDEIEILFGRGEACGVYGLLIDIGVVEVAQLFLVGAQTVVGLRQERFDDSFEMILGLDFDVVGRPGALAIGRNNCGSVPCTACESEKVIAGPDAFVHCRKVDAPTAEFRPLAALGGRRR